MLIDALESLLSETDDCCFEVSCNDPRVVKSLRDGVCPLCDSPLDLVPDMIDEFPALFAAAAVADGTTRVRGAAELRVKESDRITVMAEGLRRLGITIDETPDGATITGGHLDGGAVDSAGDHRIAMSFAVAGAVARAPVRIDDCANVATSFPGFPALARGIGLALAET